MSPRIHSKESIDRRVAELEALAGEEGIKLPMAPALIAWFEDRGYVVDLRTGSASRPQPVGMPTPQVKAVVHLLAEIEGEIIL